MSAIIDNDEEYRKPEPFSVGLPPDTRRVSGMYYRRIPPSLTRRQSQRDTDRGLKATAKLV